MNPAAPTTPPQAYVPGHLIPKLAFLTASLLILAIGLGYLRHPLQRMLHGERATARVVRIIQTQPGLPDLTYSYRRDFPELRDRSITFQHWVAVDDGNGHERLMRLGVDSRSKPQLNINDETQVVFFPGDSIAFELYEVRSWAVGSLFAFIGLVGATMAAFLVATAHRPIPIDPEHPEDIHAGHPVDDPPPSDPPPANRH